VPAAQRKPSRKPTKDRKKDGKFEPGHSLPGPGNPKLTRYNQVRALLFSDANTPEKTILQVWAALIAKAKRGHFESIKFFLEFMCGKSPVRVDVRGEGGFDLRQLIVNVNGSMKAEHEAALREANALRSLDHEPVPVQPARLPEGSVGVPEDRAHRLQKRERVVIRPPQTD
jgi:hypothetical protein